MLTSGTQCGFHRSEYGEIHGVDMTAFSEESSVYSIEEGELLE